YIIHRIHVASSRPRVEFTDKALRRIYRYSGGDPRLINILCDRVLLVAFSENIFRITGKVVKTAASELSASNSGQGAGRRLSPLPIFMLACLAVALIIITFHQLGWINSSQLHSLVERSDAAENSASILSKQTVKLGFDTDISGINSLIKSLGPDSLEESISRVLSLWRKNINMSDLTYEKEEAFIRKAAESHGLEVYRVRNNLSLIGSLGLPAVVSFQHPESMQRVFLAALSVESQKIAFHDPKRGETVQIPIESAGACWNGDAYVLWENPKEITGVIGKDADADSIAGLQMLLKAAGKSYVTINGTYDEKTRSAIKQIQAGQGLPVDGYGGAATKIVLYKLAASSQKNGSAGN
ncbi:MAG: peptidoglycan-binding protein, partial [Desulfosalsimonas sp.]